MCSLLPIVLIIIVFVFYPAANPSLADKAAETKETGTDAAAAAAGAATAAAESVESCEAKLNALVAEQMRAEMESNEVCFALPFVRVCVCVCAYLLFLTSSHFFFCATHRS